MADQQKRQNKPRSAPLTMNLGSEGLCEMCGHYVSVRQKAHILAEGKKTEENVLMLCPSCHIMFDTHIKPKLFTALRKSGITLPNSWEKSIYLQAADASRKAKEKNKGNDS